MTWGPSTDDPAEQRCSWCNYPLPAHSDICRLYRAARSNAEPSGDVEQRARELRDLLSKVTPPNRRLDSLPWRVVPCDGKPVIAGAKAGLLFRGYIGTWQEADLVAAAVNALPALLDEVERLRAITKALQSTDEVVEVLERARLGFEALKTLIMAVTGRESIMAEQFRDEVDALLAKLKGQSQ